MLALRPMTEADLPTVAGWLAEPHVARWWTPGTTAEAQLHKYRERIRGAGATAMLMASVEGRPVGWGQWYRWADYPAAAHAMQALEGEAGIDYAIADPTAVGHGLGTGLVAALVQEVRRCTGQVGLLAAPDATNVASRRVLEKNGFHLVSIRPVAAEPSQAPMTIYRLAP
jgi:aminoglycoside 6'-N-acetyltransferase